MYFKLAMATVCTGIAGYSAGVQYGGVSGSSPDSGTAFFTEDKTSPDPRFAYEFDRFLQDTSIDSRLGGKKIVHGNFYSERYGQRMYASGFFIGNKPAGQWEIRGSMDDITVTVGFLNGRYNGVFFIDNQKWHYFNFASFRNGRKISEWSSIADVRR
jgi:hypothetical protein